MNQRTLEVLNLTTALNFLAGAATTGASLDLAQDNVTTSTWTYANVGRREMKLGGFVAFIPTAAAVTPNCTNFFGLLQSGSTGAAAGTWNWIANSTFGVPAVTAGTMIFSAATGGGMYNVTPIHFMTNDRYVRAVYNVQGATTCQVAPAFFVMVEQRAS